MAQSAEHILGKDEVPSSNLGSSSKKIQPTLAVGCVFFFGLSLLIRSGLRATRESSSHIAAGDIFAKWRIPVVAAPKAFSDKVREGFYFFTLLFSLFTKFVR